MNGLEVLGENIHFDISGYFVISEFDIEGVDCNYNNILFINRLSELNFISL